MTEFPPLLGSAPTEPFFPARRADVLWRRGADHDAFQTKPEWFASAFVTVEAVWEVTDVAISEHGYAVYKAPELHAAPNDRQFQVQ